MALLPGGSSMHPWHRRAIDELHSLSLRGLALISHPLTYPLRRHVLRRALNDALGDRRLAFRLFLHWLVDHPTCLSLRAICWAHKQLALTPSETLGWDAPAYPRGEGLVLPSPQKETFL